MPRLRRPHINERVLTASHEEGPQGPLVKELKDLAPEANAARVRSHLGPAHFMYLGV